MSATFRSRKSKGLGDTIAKVTEKLKIDIAAKKTFEFFGTNCGCDARQQKLNRLFPYKDKA
jgi:glycerol dehydrogenase-like iron-containing ADH family enzyme